MTKSKNQSLILIGIGLILLSAVLAYFAFSQPKINESELIEASSTTNAAVSSQTYVSSTNQEIQSSDVNDEIDAKSEQAISDNDAVSTVSTQITANVQSSQAVQSNSTTQATSAVAYPINLNTCTIDQLVSINGIGEARADAIIQYREYLGGYTSVDQIKNIKGIGDKLFEKVSPYLTV